MWQTSKGCPFTAPITCVGIDQWHNSADANCCRAVCANAVSAEGSVYATAFVAASYISSCLQSSIGALVGLHPESSLTD